MTASNEEYERELRHARFAAYVAGYKQGANDHTTERLDQIELSAVAEGSAIHDGHAGD